jgi:hypothetical protein
MPLFNPHIEVDALTNSNADVLHNRFGFSPHLSRMVSVEWTEKHNCRINLAEIVYNKEHKVYLMYLQDIESKYHFYKSNADFPLSIEKASPEDLLTYGSSEKK